MYANLIVEYQNSKGERREVYAYAVEREANVLVVKLDDPTDESDYYQHVGERRISPENLICVTPSF